VEALTNLLKRMPLDQKKNFVWENGGTATTMLCGGFRLEEQRANPLLSTLPAALVVKDGLPEAISLKAAFGLAETEMQAGRIVECIDVRKVWSDGNDVCVFYEMTTSGSLAVEMISERFHMRGRIASIRAAKRCPRRAALPGSITWCHSTRPGGARRHGYPERALARPYSNS